MKKITVIIIAAVSVLFFALYGLNSAGVIVLSRPELLVIKGASGAISKPLGDTDGLLILAVLSAALIFIPAVSYLRKK